MRKYEVHTARGLEYAWGNSFIVQPDGGVEIWDKERAIAFYSPEGFFSIHEVTEED